MITIEKIIQKIEQEHKTTKINDKAAVLIPIVTIDDELHLLFQVRAQTLKWQPGDICFPGGHLEPCDLTAEDAAKRETNEELGIPSDNITILGQLPEFMATLGFRIYPFIGEIKSLDNLKLNTDEVEKIFTVPIDWFIKNSPRQATMQVAHKPADDFPFDLLPNRTKEWQKRSEHQLYFYPYLDNNNNEYVIWGLTAQIVKAFIDMLY